MWLGDKFSWIEVEWERVWLGDEFLGWKSSERGWTCMVTSFLEWMSGRGCGSMMMSFLVVTALFAIYRCKIHTTTSFDTNGTPY